MELLRGWDAVSACPATKDTTFPSVPLPAVQHQPSCAPASTSTLSSRPFSASPVIYSELGEFSILSPLEQAIRALCAKWKHKKRKFCARGKCLNSFQVALCCCSGSEAVLLPQAVHQTLAPRVSHFLAGPRSRGSCPSQGKARSQLLACASWEMGLCSSHYLLFIDKL